MTTKTRTGVSIAGAALLLVASGLMHTPHAAAKAPAGRIGPWDAMKTAASKVAGGKAIRATYLYEDKHWLYDVTVIKGKTITEVEVDAATGRAGATEVATPREEGRELTEDLNRAIGK